jgi:hypothetical protein
MRDEPFGPHNGTTDTDAGQRCWQNTTRKGGGIMVTILSGEWLDVDNLDGDPHP